MEEKSQGLVTQVIGAVVDVQFPIDEMPAIRDLLYVTDGAFKTPLEVEKHMGGGVVRCIALKATEGLYRGMAVENTGAPIAPSSMYSAMAMAPSLAPNSKSVRKTPKVCMVKGG